jgi:hypothetical protein
MAAPAFLKKIASPFYNFEERVEPGQEPSSAATTPATPSISATPVSRPIRSSVGKAQVDNTIKEQILSIVEKATPAILTDFFELVRSMAELPMDDATRYKSAFISFQKQTKRGIDALVDGLDKRMAALDDAESQFDEELKTSLKEVEATRKSAAQLDAKIEELNRQINELTTQKSGLLLQASQDEQKYSAQQGTFTATLNAVRTDLSAQADELKAYLAAPQSTTSSLKTKKRS